MEQVFSNVGEFRGKGNRKTRLGPRVRIGEGRRGGEKQTPDGIALKKLAKLLEADGMNARDRYSYVNLMSRAEQIRFMNMPVLASIMTYMHQNGNEITPQNFSYNQILPYIDRLIRKEETKPLHPEEKEIMRLRMAATFQRYINYVSRLRSDAEAELLEAQARAEQEAAPVMDEW